MAKRRSTPPPTARPPSSLRNRPPPSQSQNLLLAALPLEDYQRLAPALEVVPLRLKHIVHRPGEPLQHVYFPGGGFFSVLTVLQNGGMVEVATIGREGMAGVSAVFDGGRVPYCSMVQAETDTCYRITVDALRRETERHGALYELLTRFSQALMGFVMQSTACNAVHSVEQRLAPWLLHAQDRVGNDEFPLTQEFVAMMLGAARPTVTVVAGTLQKAGLIKYRHGKVTIVDRNDLEHASCECYRAAADLFTDVTSARPR
jgi:CRP-like cAMP-binding protein